MKLTNEICISFLRGSGWLYNHDKEITISERNKAIDDIKEKLMQNGFIYTQHALDVFNEMAEKLKAGGENDNLRR